MRRLALCLISLGAIAAAIPAAEAQTRRRTNDGALIVNVRPRSYLDAGKMVPVGSMSRYAGEWQARSYVASPPYANLGERYGTHLLPDPYTNGPFVGARSPIEPVDYNGLWVPYR